MSIAAAKVSGSTDIALALRWGSRTRSVRFGRWLGLIALGAVPLLAAWYLCATLYLVFHDPLLASLIARQTDMQYSYEDRIASLQAQLAQETSRGEADRHTLSITLHDLVARSVRLETRAASIDALVAQNVGFGLGRADGAAAQPRTGRSRYADDALLVPAPVPTAPGTGRPSDASTAMPVDAAGHFDRPGDSSALEPTPGRDTSMVARATGGLAASLDSAESRQMDVVQRLRDPILNRLAALRTALRLAGLSPDIGAKTAQFVGGPFVPMPDGKDGSLERTIALVQAAAVEQSRLSHVVDGVPLRRPVEGPLEITSTFGARLDPFLGRLAMHTGIDFHRNFGDKAEATASGTVTKAGPDGGYGNMVEVDHGNGLSTRYAHLSSIEVSVHQRIEAGTVVGRIGSTGRSTGPHLHYETRINGDAVDPARFLKAGASLFAN